jgi:2,3-bisphosphoglycerate-independent phosphoglycerate mutase
LPDADRAEGEQVRPAVTRRDFLAGAGIGVAATAAVAGGATRVVVHVGGPDEAAHRRDADAVVAMLERLDGELLAPLRETVAAAGGRLIVCPDHGTDPTSGRHDPAPVPAVVWGERVDPLGPDALSERATARAPVFSPAELLPIPVAAA